MTTNNPEFREEDGFRVAYVTWPDGTRHRYEETPELDGEGRAVFQYTGQVG